MRIVTIGKPEIIMSNPNSRHNYFAWPSIARLQNGKVAVVASGFRLRHVCPFGKAVISYSDNDGRTYTLPAPVIDTVLDDRDAGILPFGEKSVLVSSFNNAVDFQRDIEGNAAYAHAYLDLISPEEEANSLGSTFRISHDYGVTFGPICKSPVTSPHGPIQLNNGEILWVGRTFSAMNKPMVNDCVQAHKIYPDGATECRGTIENIAAEDMQLLSCEPHAVQLDDGKIIVHIRVHSVNQKAHQRRVFTTYQSESVDHGKTWTRPRRILSESGGAPAHLLKHSSGILISAYGYRANPYGIKVMFSADDGKTWDVGNDLYVNHVSHDIGYPCTVELSDGSLLTVFYARPNENAPAVIMQQRWRLEI